MKNYVRILFFVVVILLTSVVVNAEDMAFEYSFEDGELGDWAPRGDSVLVEVVDKEAHDGDYSLLTTGRNTNWNGPALDIHELVEEGKTYEITLWVSIANKPNGDIIMTMEKKKGSDTAWDRVAGPVNARRGRWTKITGQYTIPIGYEILTLYIESPDETLEFYIDDIKAELK